MSKKLNEVIWLKTANGKVIPNNENLEKTKDLLNSTGCGFCLAKFTQVTMHLGTGLVHACHHPTAHKIPLEELQNNPKALFNTKHLKKPKKANLTKTPLKKIEKFVEASTCAFGNHS
jgi:hypothetical protein